MISGWRSGGSAADGGPARGGLPAWVVIIAAILLAWQMVVSALAARAPSALAVRLAPGSPAVLARASAEELEAGRKDNAAHLARMSLVRAPFSVQALRVLAQTISDSGDRAGAEPLFLLAGNWSLRDDPAHGWIMKRRLEVGDYGGAFNHADTLVRRRADLRTQVFGLFTTAASEDPRALAALTRLMAARPPWRDAYVSSLFETQPGNLVLAGLAVSLQRTDGPLTDVELSHVYARWLRLGRIPGLKAIRAATGRPDPPLRLQDPDFTGSSGLEPFAWSLKTGAGFTAVTLPDELSEDQLALQVDYDGYSSAVMAEQFVMLDPGRYRLTGRERVVAGPEDSRIAWTITCLDSPRDLAARPSGAVDGGAQWKTFALDVVIPAQGCPAQLVRLIAVPGDRPAHVTAWYRGLDFQSVQ